MKEEIIVIEVPYLIAYSDEEGSRDKAIKAAEEVPLGITGSGYRADMFIKQKKWQATPRGKYNPKKLWGRE